MGSHLLEVPEHRLRIIRREEFEVPLWYGVEFGRGIGGEVGPEVEYGMTAFVWIL